MNELMSYVQHLVGCPEREGKYFQGKKLAPNVEVNANYLVCSCGAWNDPRRPRCYTCTRPLYTKCTCGLDEILEKL